MFRVFAADAHHQGCPLRASVQVALVQHGRFEAADQVGVGPGRPASAGEVAIMAPDIGIECPRAGQNVRVAPASVTGWNRQRKPLSGLEQLVLIEGRVHDGDFTEQCFRKIADDIGEPVVRADDDPDLIGRMGRQDDVALFDDALKTGRERRPSRTLKAMLASITRTADGSRGLPAVIAVFNRYLVRARWHQCLLFLRMYKPWTPCRLAQ